MTLNNVKFEVQEPGVAVVKVSRPQALNALNTATLEELISVMKNLADDHKVRVIVLTGDGDRAFVAGADITEMQKLGKEEAVRFAKLGQTLTKLIELNAKPIIAAVHGFALGGGTEIAISCDYIWASEKAVFGQPEVGIGVIPGFGATVRLARFVGWAMARELIYSGRKINAAEALQFRLVNRVLPVEGFLDAVIAHAKIVALQSHVAVARAKKLMNEFSESVGLDFKLDAEAYAFGRLFGSPDQVEGMGAFVEKRKPLFEGV